MTHCSVILVVQVQKAWSYLYIYVCMFVIQEGKTAAELCREAGIPGRVSVESGQLFRVHGGDTSRPVQKPCGYLYMFVCL